MEGVLCVATILAGDGLFGNGRLSLWNLLRSVQSPRVPLMIPSMVVLTTVTNFLGEVVIELVVRGPNQQVLHRDQFACNSDDPVAEFDALFQINELMLPEPGEYYFDILVDGKQVSGRRFLYTYTGG